MNFSVALAGLMGLILVAQGAVVPQGADQDNFMDDTVTAIENSLTNGGYDNIGLPSGGFDFEIKVGFINQKGSATFSGGQLRGLQTMRRSSSVQLEPVSSGLRVTVELNIPTASLEYAVELKFMGVTYNARVTGTVTNVKVRMVLLVDKTGKITLEEFSESGKGNINVVPSGIPSILDPITNQLTKWVGDTAANEITKVINQTFKAAIGPLVADMIFPIPPEMIQ